jgi:2-polyprenyl-6-hydroxyphenyl methylase/3-demethylubiquinone-9 3-methyltransferase
MTSGPISPPRFSFGRNWQNYASRIDEQRLGHAIASMRAAFPEGLRGKSFLDIGSGSGLFSVAAVELGAERVLSFDYDPDSVACTEWFRATRAAQNEQWVIERGDILDPSYVRSLADRGPWEIVYSWGVLHHTGEMWNAIDRALSLVSPNGQALLSLYNDQGGKSRVWTRIKLAYNRAPKPLQMGAAGVYSGLHASGVVVKEAVRGKNPIRRFRGEGRRGMGVWHDAVDWLGGYPFEVASRADVLSFGRSRGFDVTVTRDVGRKNGCNEFRFTRQERPKRA